MAKQHWLWGGLFVATLAIPVTAATLQPETVRDWNQYVAATESRIDREFTDRQHFLAHDFIAGTEAAESLRAIRAGQVGIVQLTTTDAAGQPLNIHRGLVHHWVAAVFIPNVDVAPLVEWLKDYDHYAADYDEVEEARLLPSDGETLHPFLRLRRKKVVTVWYHTEYDVRYRVHTPSQVSSRCVSTRIAELENVGESSEKEKPIGDDSGYLWRLNAYWRFSQVDGGVIAECESLSLSRRIPPGFGWLVRGFVDTVPRESLTATLESLRRGAITALGKPSQDGP